MYSLQFGAPLVDLVYSQRFKILLTDTDDAEMRNVKLSIITAAIIIIILMFGAVSE